jgi:hypothetical protein
MSELKKLAELRAHGQMTCTAKDVLDLIAENERNAKNATEWEAASLHWMAERDQLKAELDSVEPYFEDVERLCKVLGYLGVSTPEGGEEKATRWLSLVRTMIRTAETSKLLRQDAEKIAEYDQLRAENAGLRTGYEAYERVNADLKDEVAKRKGESGSDSETIYRLSCNLAQRTGEVRELAGVVDDLCAMTKRFVQRLRKAKPADTLPDQALGYLKRKGLQGSPMRAIVEARLP